MKKKRQSYRVRFTAAAPIIVNATCEAQAWHIGRGIAGKEGWKIESVGRVMW
jgi:hypothetical protein